MFPWVYVPPDLYYPGSVPRGLVGLHSTQFMFVDGFCSVRANYMVCHKEAFLKYEQHDDVAKYPGYV
jgi:hypothetical protein